MLIPREEETSHTGIGLEPVFGTLQADTHVLQLASEPLTGVLGGLPARFKVLIDEFGGERIGEIDGDLGTHGVDSDFDDTGLAGGANFVVLFGVGDGLIAWAGWFGVGEVEEFAPSGGAGGFRRCIQPGGGVALEFGKDAVD